MQLSDFDYELPEELIAQEPLAERDASRMLVVNRETQTWTDETFKSFPDYVKSNDVIVVNNTRVFPARLIGERDPTGGRVEVLLAREVGESVWEALVRPGHRLKVGARVLFGSQLRAEVVDDASEQGFRRLKFEGELPLDELLEKLGQTPLPPYIKRPGGTSPGDRIRYQTVFANVRGAIAAPTAGLHFTPQVIETIRARGAAVAEVTLHVGYGTFEPVRVNDISAHRVSPESFDISTECARLINKARKQNGRVIAVGTTTTRALESSASDQGMIEAESGQTKLTITPGFRFRAVDALLTNFHLPQSSLLLLVSAFAGYELTMSSYRFAVANRFRFYSYGDCMLVV
ncbi:MAG TPA: tRNA preQ1(34) S-adenosylmethionine ribosyltransferase-isomerase QueA [Pyrinomonadaceae bacterium]